MCFNSLSAQKKPTAQQPQTLQKPDIRKAIYSPLWSRCGHHAALPDTKTLSDVTKHNLEHDFYCLKQSQNPCRAPGGPPCTGPYLLLWPCFCHCPLAQSALATCPTQCCFWTSLFISLWLESSHFRFYGPFLISFRSLQMLSPQRHRGSPYLKQQPCSFSIPCFTFLHSPLYDILFTHKCAHTHTLVHCLPIRM